MITNELYNQYAPADTICENIINYLYENSINFWKLLYYTDKTPLYHDVVSLPDMANMICKDPSIENSTSTKNILFQMDIDDGNSLSIPQVRLRVCELYPINYEQAYMQIQIGIFVPNKLMNIITEKGQVLDRSVSILREITKAINGLLMPDGSGGTIGNSAIFQNRNAPHSAGKNTGWTRIDNVNKNYSGWIGIFSILI